MSWQDTDLVSCDGLGMLGAQQVDGVSKLTLSTLWCDWWLWWAVCTPRDEEVEVEGALQLEVSGGEQHEVLAALSSQQPYNEKRWGIVYIKMLKLLPS